MPYDNLFQLIYLLLIMNSLLILIAIMLYFKFKKSKNKLIHSISHDLRTPVTSIKGFIEMMLDGSYGQVPDELKEPLNYINDGAKRLVGIANDLTNKKD